MFNQPTLATWRKKHVTSELNTIVVFIANFNIIHQAYIHITKKVLSKRVNTFVSSIYDDFTIA